MIKKLIISLICFVSSFYCFSLDLHLGVVEGITGIPAAELSNQVSQKEDYQYSLEVCTYSASQDLLSSLLKNDIDFAVLSSDITEAAEKKLPDTLKKIAVVQNVNLCLITTTKKVKSYKDLSGKVIYSPVKAGSIQNALIKKTQAINNDETQTSQYITYDFSLNYDELEKKLISGEVEYAVIPQSYVEVLEKKIKFKQCFTDEELLLQNQSLMYLICKRDFYFEEEDIIKLFFRDYEQTIQLIKAKKEYRKFNFIYEEF